MLDIFEFEEVADEVATTDYFETDLINNLIRFFHSNLIGFIILIILIVLVLFIIFYLNKNIRMRLHKNDVLPEINKQEKQDKQKKNKKINLNNVNVKKDKKQKQNNEIDDDFFDNLIENTLQGDRKE